MLIPCECVLSLSLTVMCLQVTLNDFVTFCFCSDLLGNLKGSGEFEGFIAAFCFIGKEKTLTWKNNN